MAFRSLQESNSLALAPQPEADPESEEQPLPPTPSGYPVIETYEQFKALGQQIKDLVDIRHHPPEKIAQ